MYKHIPALLLHIAVSCQLAFLNLRSGALHGQADYCMRIDNTWTVDGAARARDASAYSACFINHSRTRWNVKRRTHRSELRVALFAARDIEAWGRPLLCMCSPKQSLVLPRLLPTDMAAVSVGQLPAPFAVAITHQRCAPRAQKIAPHRMSRVSSLL